MAEVGDRSAGPEFGVETIELDLAPLAARLGKRLRDAGLPVTPERSAGFARALTLVRPERRGRLYWTARSTFLTDESQGPAFDAAFHSVFGEPTAEREHPEDAETVPAPPDERTASGQARSEGAPAKAPSATVASAPPRERDADEPAGVEVPAAIASEAERLARKRFDALDPDELAQLYRMMSRLELATPRRRTRRFERARHGRRVDLRRTLRASLRTGGEAVRVARRRRRVVRRRLVMLCDISGSMEPYARAYLQFLTCAAGADRRAEAFAFATRLTRLTRALASRRPEAAIQRAAATAPDWSSGTRIGEALKEFNDRHGRRGIARGAVVVILSDGWERGDPELVAHEMARLARLAHRIVWVNPRAGADGFTPRAGGMVAALQHCDALVSGHSFEALGEVVEAIASPSGGAGAARAARLRAAGAATGVNEDEPWASATPIPGSSVAMPSGHGPSRGRTTPGWASDAD